MSDLMTVVLPGDDVPPDDLPKAQNKKKALKLGPGLRHIPPETITTTIAGALVTDARKNAAWIEYNSGRVSALPSAPISVQPIVILDHVCHSRPRQAVPSGGSIGTQLTLQQYLASVGDLVIATVLSSTSEHFNCYITPHTHTAALPHLAFEGANRKNQKKLPPHSLVYARIVNSGKDSIPEITCVDASTGKGEGLGPLNGGMVFKISLSMARRLLAGRKGGVSVLEGLSEKMGFEVAIGRNGMLWVDAGSVKATLAVGRAVQEADEQGLGEKGQKKAVDRALKKI
ncbi:hypothetical protein EJ04DRAFT_507088 [Polyplosphaeria fusca]|uniref:Ribosomal RNA-processing protein 40 n=1 Tax=Polyplosphaeria fusca TaxID=682080 RepID=A0A9P4R8M9_9PLEO|nr:hypothetical protein EJ04DRAFT_507088 [Polyplosphaeria fusca]